MGRTVPAFLKSLALINISIFVIRFSNLSAIGSKIPSVILYDKNLQIRAIGAQTVLDIVLVDAETEEWVKAEQYVGAPNSFQLLL